MKFIECLSKTVGKCQIKLTIMPIFLAWWWWLMTLIPTLGRKRQEVLCEFEVSLKQRAFQHSQSYTEISGFRNKTQ